MMPKSKMLGGEYSLRKLFFPLDMLPRSTGHNIGHQLNIITDLERQERELESYHADVVGTVQASAIVIYSSLSQCM